MSEIEILDQNDLPIEYELICKIRDMWASNCRDDEIRDILKINLREWKKLLRLMKELGEAEMDNFIAFEKYSSKTHRKAEELRSIRLRAEAHDELAVALKCFQLETTLDKNLVEVAQKLNVLSGQVINIKTDVVQDVRLTNIFAHLSEEEQEKAKKELMELSQLMLSEGYVSSESNGQGRTDTEQDQVTK